jgi:hypothetical protein
MQHCRFNPPPPLIIYLPSITKEQIKFLPVTELIESPVLGV